MEEITLIEIRTIRHGIMFPFVVHKNSIIMISKKHRTKVQKELFHSRNLATKSEKGQLGQRMTIVTKKSRKCSP